MAAPAVPATAIRAEKPSRRAESEDPRAHRRLAAEQMGDSAQIEPQAVGAGDGGARSPAAGGEQAEAGEEGGVALRIGVADVEAGDQHARLGERHAGRRPSARASGRRRR